MSEVTIERLGVHGDGIAEGPVFVPRSLPGETVSGEIEGDRMTRPKIVTPSPDRVAPPCRHYRTCGGCALQHTRDDVVAHFKQDVVAAALMAHGIETDVRLVHTSPVSSRRRAALSGRRTKSGAIVGFHATLSDALTAVPDCSVLTPGIIDVFPALETLTREFGSRRGEMRFAVTDTPNGVDLDISGATTPPPDGISRAIAIARDAGLSRLTWEGEDIAIFAVPRVSFDGIGVPLPPRGFLQATRAAETALRHEVISGLEDCKGRILDLFAGLGTFSLPLARHHPVHAVESDGAALVALDTGWRGGDGLQEVTTETRDLFRRPLLPDELSRFAAAVLDPPRAGAQAQIAEIAKSDLSRVVHVSCNPATFARDAASLVGAGFRIGPVSVVDQFRWTPHVELVSTFRR